MTDNNPTANPDNTDLLGFRDKYMDQLIEAQYQHIEALTDQTREEYGEITWEHLIVMQLGDLDAAIMRWLEDQKAENWPPEIMMARFCTIIAPPDMLDDPNTVIDKAQEITAFGQMLLTRLLKEIGSYDDNITH